MCVRPLAKVSRLFLFYVLMFLLGVGKPLNLINSLGKQRDEMVQLGAMKASVNGH